MARPVLSTIVLTFLVAPLAGCMDGSSGATERAFGSIPAPVWEPGYEWTYKATQAYSFKMPDAAGGTNSESHSNTVTFRVTNDSRPIGGRDVYYVSSSQPLENPLFAGTSWALAKDDLGVVAHANTGVGMMDGVAPPQACMVSADGGPAMCGPYNSAEKYDPCNGVTPLDEATPGEQPQLLQFPLEQGKSWAGDWMGDVPGAMHYTARIHGQSKIDTPAGPVSAVRITYTFNPTDVAPSDLPAGTSVTVQVTNWYSADVGYLVKSIFTGSVHGSPFGDTGEGDMSFTSSLELQSYHLVAGTAEAAPPSRSAASLAKPTPYQPYEIVSDTAFPLNVANGSVPVTFGLKAVNPSVGYSPYRDPVKVDAVDPTLDIDHATHEVLWVLHDDSQGRATESRGDTFTTNLTRGAAYSLHTRILPKECGEQRLGSADTSFHTFWERTFHVAIDPGAQRTLDVATIPITQSPGIATAQWTWKPALSQRLDDGAPQLVSPSGKAMPGTPKTDGADWNPMEPGSWKLQWVTKSATIGDDVDLTLHVDYNTGPYYLPSP